MDENIIIVEKPVVIERNTPIALLVAAPAIFAITYFMVWTMTTHFRSILMTAAVALIGTVIFTALSRLDYTFSKASKCMAGIFYVFCLSYVYTDNGFICGLVTVFEGILLDLLVCNVCHPFDVSDSSLPVLTGAATLNAPLTNSGELTACSLELIKRTSFSVNIIYGLLGLVFTIPLTVIIGNLLSSADNGVGQIIGNLFGNIHFEIAPIIIRIILTLIIGSFAFSILYWNTFGDNCKNPSDEDAHAIYRRFKTVPGIALITGSIPAILLYCIFFYSQSTYLFSAFAGNAPSGFTYADYARQGFFELCILSIINLGIIMCIYLLDKSGNAFAAAKKIISMIICSFTLALIGIALRKMILYIENYSLTPLRLYTSAFMVLLALFFVLIMIKLIRGESFKLFKLSGILFVSWFFLLVFSRPDYIIARVNVDMYTSGNVSHLDVSELQNLSADAWGYLAGSDKISNYAKSVMYNDINLSSDTSLNISAGIAAGKLKQIIPE